MNKKYSEIRSDLNTGDIVLFSGKGGISAGVKWITRSEWSHVGMVLNDRKRDHVQLWEAPKEKGTIADYDTKKPRKGVRLVDLSERVKLYNGEIAVRHLKDAELNPDSLDSLMKLRIQLKGRKYEQDKLELMKAAYDGPFGRNEEDLSSLFCSELVAEAYQCLGLLTQQKPSNEYTPADFSAGKGIKLIKGYLSPEMMIEAD